MKWILFLPLAAASARAQAGPQALVPALAPTVNQTMVQTYVKPYSLSFGISQKFERKIIGPTATNSPYEFDNSVSVGINYRTPRDRIKLGISYSHTIQNGTDAVTAEIRYNILQWGKRPMKRNESIAP